MLEPNAACDFGTLFVLGPRVVVTEAAVRGHQKQRAASKKSMQRGDPRVRADPACPERQQAWCKACEVWKPDTEFYTSALGRGFWFCKACAIKTGGQRRRERRAAAGQAADGGIRKRAAPRRPMSADELTLRLLVTGGTVVLEGRTCRLVDAPCGGEAAERQAAAGG